MQADDSLSNRAGLDVNDTAVDRCADDTAVDRRDGAEVTSELARAGGTFSGNWVDGGWLS